MNEGDGVSEPMGTDTQGEPCVEDEASVEATVNEGDGVNESLGIDI